MFDTKTIKHGVIGVAAVCAVAAGVYGFSASTSLPASAQTPPVVTPAPGPDAHPERHPEINRAIRALTNAQKALSIARHDYDGHRVKALDLTNQALAECQAALASDQK